MNSVELKDKSIGLIEYKTITAGISGTDAMVKTADIELIEAQTVCPGKYIVLFSGKLSSINAAVEAGKRDYAENIIDSFILGNPEEDIFKAIKRNRAINIEEVEALGIIETLSAASIIVAADVAAKTAHIKLIEIRIAKDMCGKAFLLLTGELASVEASVAAASKRAAEDGMLLAKNVIANPDRKVWEAILI
jgi:microcompartment protein CcmL/EutN